MPVIVFVARTARALYLSFKAAPPGRRFGQDEENCIRYALYLR